MKWAVLSDVHGNLEALNAVLSCLTKEHIDRLAHTGDLVGYGANPNECIEVLREKANIIVAGNHDYGAVGLTDTATFNSSARAAIEWTKKELSCANRAFLSELPLLSVEEDLTFVHSTPCNPQDWRYLFSWSDVMKGFNFCQSQICFVGHSHVPAVFVREEAGEVFSLKAGRVEEEEGSRYIINAGSVGQPRDAVPDASFCVYDSKENVFSFKRVSYDIETAQKKIIQAGLPEYLAQRIALGM